MLQSFPTKAKSAQRSGKKLVEYSFMGGIPQKIETRSKERGLEDSEQKTCYYSKLYCQAGTFTRCPAQLLDVGWFCGFFYLRIWSLENRRSYGARKKHKRLPRLAMKCFRPCFFYISQSLSGNAMTGLRSCQIFFCPTVRKFFISLCQCPSPGKPQMARTKIALQQTQGIILNERSW